MSTFTNIFIEYGKIDFEISKRSQVRFEAVREKLMKSKAIPLIVDVSINGYSNKDDFDFEVSNTSWSEVKDIFEKGEDAQKNPEALTIKRAIRLCAPITSKYISEMDVYVPLQKYSPDLPKQFCHLGAHFIVDEENVDGLINLWKNFDSIRNQKISTSVCKILKLRFPKLDFE